MPSFSNGIDYGCFDKSLNNALKSVSERFLFIKNGDKFEQPPEPKTHFSERLERFKSKLKEHATFIPPVTKDQFLGTYTGRKLLNYQRAFESLKRKPLRQTDSYVSWFMKVEKIEFKKNKETVPRGISPRHPRYHVSLGLFVKRMEKKIYHDINNIFGGTTVFKGLNAFERGKHLRNIWDSFDEPVAIPIDAKRFDQHVSRPMLQWEHSIYNLYNNSKEFNRLLSWQLDNKFFANLKGSSFKFKTKGKRCSGDMTTSLGNVVIMCAMLYSYLSERLQKFRLADDGDDAIIFIERKDLHKINDLYESVLEFGFQLEIEPHVFDFEKIEFCQSQPVYTPDGYVMVRNPLKSMAKDTMCIHSDPSLYDNWLSDVADCGLSLTSGIPIMQEFYTKIKHISKPRKVNTKFDIGMKFISHNMTHTYREPHWKTRYSFYLAFDICPDRQVILEDYIRKLPITTKFNNMNSPLRDFPF